LFVNTQFGGIVEAIKPEKNFYRLRLVDSGTIVTAIPLQQSRGASTRFEPGDNVVVSYAAGAWWITGLVPLFALDKNGSPRLKDLAPGDAFYGNAATGAGVHVTGGQVSVEAAGFDASGKPRRAAGSYWVPDNDAIINLCRRFGIKGAPGDLQMLQDDKTKQTAFRVWIRESSNPAQNGRTSRIHMGYHKSPPGAVFSIATFPPGTDPTAATKKLQKGLMDAETQKLPFAGQWPVLERDDWQTRYYAMTDGTVIFESAMVPAPSMTPTTTAQAKTRVIITPEGFITTTADQLVTLNAMNNLIALKQSYTMTANTASFTIKQFFAVEAETITLFSKGGAPASVLLGKLEDTLPLCNMNFFEYFLNEFLTWAMTHTHPTAAQGPPSPPTPSPPTPDNTSITSATNAS
jgi:hypothetical protein